MATNTEPAWYQNMISSGAGKPPLNTGAGAEDVLVAPGGPYTLRNETPNNSITCSAGGVDMLKVSPEGFWVRGIKVEQDEQEAQAVYEGFKAWMMWAQMTRDYR